jgi:putative CocE/NonD family hydrolase
MKSHWSVFAALAVLALPPETAHGVSPEALADAARVEFEWGVRIPLRDGVHLNATVYRPRDAAGPQPCIFTLTPYISQSYHDRGMYFAAHGYPFLTVDVRGRGNSEGTFRPLIQEAHDGYDVVEWLARQPYCNGKVTMWGGSYAGYDQWATAKEFPPHLATIVPVASPYAGIDFPGRTNIFYPYDVEWLTLVSGRASQSAIFADDAFWITAFRRWYESGAPFRRLDAMVGNVSPVFQEWLSHPDGDAYWDSYNPTADEYARLEIPLLTITGIYDGDQLGALEHYRRHMKNGSAAGRARHYLVIGPWDHAGTRTPKAQFGGLKFGPASLVDLGKLHLDWYGWTMQEGAKPKFLQQPVAYYVTGAEKWRYAESLEAVTAESRPFFLDSDGDSARDVFDSGSLKTGLHGSGDADRYVYDPRDTSAAALEVTADPDSLVDQRMLYAAGPRLVYHSAPFEKDTEISGFFRFAAWIALDQADTDFFVAVYEVTADASVLPLAADAMRARYRDGLRTQQLIADRTAHRYEFDHFTFAARLLRKGSRLRLVLAAGNSIYTQRNSNAGGVVAEESIGDARPVLVKLYHDRRRPSALYVPIASAEPAAAPPPDASVNGAAVGATR